MRTTLMLLPLVAAAVLYAEDTTAQQLKVREMIQTVQNAPEGERFQKMNEFKQMIRSMNAEKRFEAISQMREATQAAEQTKKQERTQTRTRVRTKEGEGEMTRTQTRKQMQNLQNQQSQQQMQQRNQRNNQQQLGRAITSQPGTMPKGPGNGKYGNRH
jgi:Fe2+ transport system protein B